MPRRSSAALPFSEASTSRVKPPDDLTGDARTVFVDLVLSTRPDHFQELDVATLCVFCEAVVLAKAATAGLKADGYVSAEPSGLPADPTGRHADRLDLWTDAAFDL